MSVAFVISQETHANSLFSGQQNFAPRQFGPFGGFGGPQGGQQQFPGVGVQFQVPNYNQLFNQQAQFQNQLLNNFNQLSNQFLTALTGGYGQQQRPPQPPYNGGGFPPFNGGQNQNPTYPTVPTHRPQPPRPAPHPHPQPKPQPQPHPRPQPEKENTDELINEIFTRPPTDEESGADLIDIRVDENEEKTRRRREAPAATEEVGVDNRFGLGKHPLRKCS